MADFLVKIENNTYFIDILDTKKVKVNDEEFEYQLNFSDNGEYVLNYGNKIYEATILSKNDSFMSIAIDNDVFEIEIKDKAEQLLEIFNKGREEKLKDVIIKAPMPGLVLKILVNIGQKVDKGTSLLILEAMKMENEIKSYSTGIVKEIKVKEKTSVEKGDILIILE